MIISKLNIGFFWGVVVIFTQCYTEPFFDLTVSVINPDQSPAENVVVKVKITDIDDGSVVDGSIIDFEAVTNSGGTCDFSFDNKVFLSVLACDSMMCRDGHIYIEENITNSITLMLDSGDCLYCP